MTSSLWGGLGGKVIVLLWVLACAAGPETPVGAGTNPTVTPPSPQHASPPALRRLVAAIPTPEGFTRVEVAERSFPAWLRELSVRPEGTPVRAWDGSMILAGDDPRLGGVIELDVGRSDLQQCADTAIRLHAEWLWAIGEADSAAYAFTSGHLARWSAWADGFRPEISGSKVQWVRSAPPVSHQDRAAWRAWLNVVFTYARTRSLDATLKPVREPRGGDVFVQGGGPGHAVIVLDLAVDSAGRHVAVMGQGFMPAQDLHVLRDGDGDAWFLLDGSGVRTPFWAPFGWDDLRRFPDPD